ncbi:MAG TPA: aminotransferase class III-fold pyridoxal phosphate-dependent enzyme [Blastocatellia bacterium]|nr:aminotransferase class III-fold pyridoxal phosphate-dependent enzyme [Blastocatellia bacterium]
MATQTQLENVIDIEEQYQVATYKKFPFVIESGQDVWVYTSDGKRYLDLYGGHAVVSTGHSHPRVVRALAQQAGRLIFYSNLVYNETRARAAKLLVGVAPPLLSKSFFCNSGTEANENAIKIARKLTAREKVISFEGSFHGRTPGSLAATGLAKYRAGITPMLAGHVYSPFDDIDAAEKMIDEKTAAVILEPIQSMGGVRMARPGFYEALRELCDRGGAMLIYDEVQTGIGRTGEFFFAGRFGVTPDMVTLAKGIASGVPMGAVLMTEAIAGEIKTGDLGTTFGGGPLACAALEATVDVIVDEGLLDNVRLNSAYLFDALGELDSVEEVRGLGYLIGIKFKGGSAKPYQEGLLERQIITGLADDTSVLRLLPPLTLRRPEIDLFLDGLRQIDHG